MSTSAPDHCGEFSRTWSRMPCRTAGWRGAAARAHGATNVQRLSDLAPDATARLEVPIGEIRRVLGGSLVPGSVNLIGGDPGIGKSTLLLQLAAAMCPSLGSVLYVS